MNNNNYYQQQSTVDPAMFVRQPGQGIDPLRTRILGGLACAFNECEANQKSVPSSVMAEGYDESFTQRSEELRMAAIQNNQKIKNQIRAEQQRGLDAIRRHEEQMRQQQMQQQYQYQQQPVYNQYGQSQQYGYIQPQQPQPPQPVQYTQYQQPIYQQQVDNSPVTMLMFNKCINSIADELISLKNLIKDSLNNKVNEQYFEDPEDIIEEEVESNQSNLPPFLPGLEPNQIDPEDITDDELTETNIRSGINEDGKPIHRKIKVTKKPKLKVQTK